VEVQTLPAVTHGTLHLRAGGEASRPGDGPTMRDVASTLAEVQRALDLGWTLVPLDILLEEHDGGPLPVLPRYEVATLKMASPLEIAITIPPEVLSIPAAMMGLTLAIERVLNCKVRVLAKREALEAERSEALERRLAAEARIREHRPALQRTAGSPSPLQVTSAEIHLEEQ
jgi:hypothetical protein